MVQKKCLNLSNSRVNLEYNLGAHFRTWGSIELSELKSLPQFISVIIQTKKKKYLDGEQYNISDTNLGGFIEKNEELLYDNLNYFEVEFLIVLQIKSKT